MSLTGDPDTEHAVGPAHRLVRAVHRYDAYAVRAVLNEIHAGGPVTLRNVVMVLAAMVPDDTTPNVLLAWLSDPAEYRKQRARGVSSLVAGARARMSARRRREIA